MICPKMWVNHIFFSVILPGAFAGHSLALTRHSISYNTTLARTNSLFLFTDFLVRDAVLNLLGCLDVCVWFWHYMRVGYERGFIYTAAILNFFHRRNFGSGAKCLSYDTVHCCVVWALRRRRCVCYEIVVAPLPLHAISSRALWAQAMRRCVYAKCVLPRYDMVDEIT